MKHQITYEALKTEKHFLFLIEASQQLVLLNLNKEINSLTEKKIKIQPTPCIMLLKV
jgi:hypothetical protein